ncbi:MAG: hypothetical protein OEU26_10625 [Candidatus Tectomicrobia bacterium]|nr:hypothetical protein [Candidatus Tectomicrobia bacterium]
MWQRCPLRQNDPIYLVAGLQLSDLYMGFALMAIAVIIGQSVAGLLFLPCVLYGLRHLRKNKAAGMVARLLHWLGLWRIPGALPAQPFVYRIF